MLSLRWRLTLNYTAVFVLALIIFSLALYGILQHYLLRQADENLALQAAEVSYKFQGRSQGKHGAMHLPVVSVFTNPGTYFQIIGLDGEIIAKSTNLGEESLPIDVAMVRQVEQQGAVFQTLGSEGESLRVYNLLLTRDNQVFGIFQAAQSLAPITNLLQRLLQVLLFVGLFMTVLVALLGYYLARSALAPVGHLTEVAENISETHDLEKRVEHRGPHDEIGRLAAAFNKMLERLAAAQESLARSYTAQRRFVADVSHELRTPLTIIRGNLELLQKLPPEEKASSEALADAAGEADRMTRLLQNLLQLARADAGQEIAKEPLDLQRLLQDLERQAPLLGPQEFHSEGLQVLAGIQVLGSPDYLKQLFLILLDNAYKYTPPQGAVTLKAGLKGERCQISVSDSGPGIPQEELSHIFERFYRGKAGRAGGTGLGLAIARWIALSHGGNLEAESAPGRGTTFTLSLPIFKNF